MEKKREENSDIESTSGITHQSPTSLSAKKEKRKKEKIPNVFPICFLYLDKVDEERLDYTEVLDPNIKPQIENPNSKSKPCIPKLNK